VLSLDPFRLHGSVPLIANELATLVVMQTDDLLACLLLHKRFVCLECSQGLALLAKQHNDTLTQVIVDEGDPVAIA
jgi:hypothetical protein